MYLYQDRSWIQIKTVKKYFEDVEFYKTPSNLLRRVKDCLAALELVEAIETDLGDVELKVETYPKGSYLAETRKTLTGLQHALIREAHINIHLQLLVVPDR